MTINALPDSELVTCCRGGDKEAFEELYRRYVRRIYNLAYRMVGPGQEPEELTQEIFLQAYATLHRFRGDSSFYTWLYRVGCNVCLVHLKQRCRRRETVGFHTVTEQGLRDRVQPGPQEVVERRQFERVLATSLDQLKPSHRAVLLLGPIDGNTYEHMSKLLGLSVAIIKGRMHRARLNLRSLCRREVSACVPVRTRRPSATPSQQTTVAA